MQVKFARKKGYPFLTYNGVHAAITTLGNMNCGIEISLSKLTSVDIAPDGQTARIGGGAQSKNVVDTLWAAGKQTVTGACECVSYMGPALGGGHGWLQGRHGLIADQILSMNVVLADGTLTTIGNNDPLMWAMKGAGANFGIVTSVMTQIYDIQHSNWAGETITFSGDKVDAVYKTANDVIVRNGAQPVDLANWSYWLNTPADPTKPVIVFFILQEGVNAVDPSYTQPFHDIGTLSVQPMSGTYLDLAAWTDVSLKDPPCQKDPVAAHPRFPIYLDTYNPTAMTQAYDLYAAQAGPSSPFNNSIFMFESYAHEGVDSIPADSTAFAFRENHLLTAPLINYAPANDATLTAQAKQLGDQLREVLHQGSGQQEVHAYVNYAYGDENDQEWYGYESWRQTRLHNLKSQFDPTGQFSFFAPIN